MLQSQLFSSNARLRDCEVKDSAHVLTGNVGEFVRLIQEALRRVDGADITPAEIKSGTYGPSTTKAVLAYKTRRNIINHSYQSKADAIVGKMTIVALDRDVFDLENEPDIPFGGGFTRPIARRR